MSVLDTLITKFVLDPGAYEKGASAVMRATSAMGNRIKDFGLGVLSNLGRTIANPLTALMGGLGFGSLIIGASKAAGEFDALKMGLAAVAGGMDEAERQLKRLQEVAKLPGLSFEEAIQGSINLQAAGFSAQLAERALMGFGNALATVGRGRAELQGVLMALTQMAAKGKIQAEEILQISERVPQIRRLMQGAFGTSDTEQLQKMGISASDFVERIVGELEKLPKAGDSAKNAWENLAVAGRRLMFAIGGPINSIVIPAMQKVTGFIEYLVGSGTIERATKGLVEMLGRQDLGDALIRALSWIIALIEHIPSVIQTVKDKVIESFGLMRENLYKFAAILGAIFLGTTILNGITKLIAALRALITTVRTLGITAMIMEAVATGGLSLGKAAIGAALGAAAGAAIAYSIDQMMGQMPNLTEGAPTIDEIGKRAKEIENEYKKSQGPIESTGGAATEPTLGPLERIAENTKRTAENTQKLADIQDSVMGGAVVGAGATSAVSIGKIMGGRSSGGSSVKAMLNEAVDLIYKASQQASLEQLQSVAQGSPGLGGRR